MKEINGDNKAFFGIRKSDNTKIYLSKPSWDCGWYWGFGYLGNANEHYHLSGYADDRNINMYDALINDYELSDGIKNNLWLFCELVQTAYTLKKTAEVLGRGGSNYTSNPLSSLIKNKDEVERINNVVLPEIFNSIANILSEN